MEKGFDVSKNNEILLLRTQLEYLADKLCLAVKGEFDFSIEANSTDESMQKLVMLINFVLDAARRSLVSLREQNAKLTELDKLKSDFLANVSHELRTPLTLILAPLQTILNEPLSISQKNKDDLLRIQRNAEKLYALVNDLLDFSQLEAGKLTLHEELIDLNQLISQLVDDAKGLATERQLMLQFSETNKVGLMLFDRKAIEKIIVNLVGNSLKFTPKGGRISVLLEKQNDTIKLVVSDTGIGIPADKIQNLFERFYQVDTSSTRYHEGTGIGLSLVKQYIDLMQGKILVESKEGEGTAFTVTLPIHSIPKRELTQQTKQKIGQEAETANIRFSNTLDKKSTSDGILFLHQETPKPRVLIADDNEDMRFYMVSLLKDCYEVVAVANGKMALDAIYEYQPQVVLSDVMMPLLDGYQLTRKIKMDPKICHIPIILITAKVGKEALTTSLEIGADDYLAKPFSPEELKARTDTALKGYENYKKIIDLNASLVKEIEERKRLEHKNLALNNQLIVAARTAGMADVTTSVLHNVGNALNSINTSVSIVNETISKSRISNLVKLFELLNENQGNLREFIDAKGPYIINYLSELSNAWNGDKTNLLTELNLLTKNVQHVKDIIVKQNTLSTVLGVHEKIIVSELVEDALMLNKSFYEKACIKIICNFSPIKNPTLDRVKLLQILVNLIKNSAEALKESEIEDKKISIFIGEKDHKHFFIKVQDNGIGVLPENLEKIFSVGFTLKKGGHGFGLHTSALAAKEMGGNLSVESKGKNKGATFTISLPYQIPTRLKRK